MMLDSRVHSTAGLASLRLPLRTGMRAEGALPHARGTTQTDAWTNDLGGSSTSEARVPALRLKDGRFFCNRLLHQEQTETYQL